MLQRGWGVTMDKSQNINSQRVNSSQRADGTSSPAFTDLDLQKENKGNLSELEALRSKIITDGTVASSARMQAKEYTQQAQKYVSEAKTSPALSAIKELLRMAKEMIQRAKEAIKIMKGASLEAKEAKAELRGKSKFMNSAEQNFQLDVEDPNGFLFNQQPDNPITSRLDK